MLEQGSLSLYTLTHTHIMTHTHIQVCWLVITGHYEPAFYGLVAGTSFQKGFSHHLT